MLRRRLRDPQIERRSARVTAARLAARNGVAVHDAVVVDRAALGERGPAEPVREATEARASMPDRRSSRTGPGSARTIRRSCCSRRRPSHRCTPGSGGRHASHGDRERAGNRCRRCDRAMVANVGPLSLLPLDVRWSRTSGPRAVAVMVAGERQRRRRYSSDGCQSKHGGDAHGSANRTHWTSSRCFTVVHFPMSSRR